MKSVNGCYAMTAHELAHELMELGPDAVVTVGVRGEPYTRYTIYKMEHAADETEACLFTSGPLPRNYAIKDAPF